MFVLLIILTLLAVARAARLVTVDKITEPLRNWVGKVAYDAEGYVESEGRPKLLYFITCPWCTSIWIGALAATGAVLWPTNRVVWILAVMGAASEVAGFMAAFEERLDRDCCGATDRE